MGLLILALNNEHTFLLSAKRLLPSLPLSHLFPSSSHSFSLPSFPLAVTSVLFIARSIRSLPSSDVELDNPVALSLALHALCRPIRLYRLTISSLRLTAISFPIRKCLASTTQIPPTHLSLLWII